MLVVDNEDVHDQVLVVDNEEVSNQVVNDAVRDEVQVGSVDT